MMTNDPRSFCWTDRQQKSVTLLPCPRENISLSSTILSSLRSFVAYDWLFKRREYKIASKNTK
jgi:hypothetical protein